MTGKKPDLSKVRLVPMDPPMLLEPPPPVTPDPGAIFVDELDSILSDAREAGLSDDDMLNLIKAFVPDFPIRSD